MLIVHHGVDEQVRDLSVGFRTLAVSWNVKAEMFKNVHGDTLRMNGSQVSVFEE